MTGGEEPLREVKSVCTKIVSKKRAIGFEHSFVFESPISTLFSDYLVKLL